MYNLYKKLPAVFWTLHFLKSWKCQSYNGESASLQSALVVSLANIQVPILLGEVVNVVARFIREAAVGGRSFSQEVAGPVLTLVKYYFIQVSKRKERK